MGGGRRSLREEDVVNYGCVKWVAQMGGPVVQRTFTGDSSLDGESQESDHGQAGMLDLRQLKHRLLLRVRRQPQWIEELSTWVQPLFWVQLCISLELNVPDHQNFDPDQRGHREWKWLAKVR